MNFEWDSEKERSNRPKHGIGFEEAASVFGVRFALSWQDRTHSLEEYRTLTLGYTLQLRLVLVAHTERADRVRIISARPATATERRLYESG